MVCLIVACDDPISQFVKKSQTKSGLDAAMAQLPGAPLFEVVKSVTFEYVESEPGFGPDYYLARGYVIFGSSLPEQDALNTYFQKVQALGWVPRREQYTNSKVLRRASNELMEIYIGNPGVDINDTVDYALVRVRYKGVIFVRVDYMVPPPTE